MCNIQALAQVCEKRNSSGHCMTSKLRAVNSQLENVVRILRSKLAITTHWVGTLRQGFNSCIMPLMV